MKFDPYGTWMIMHRGNCILILFHLYRCGKHKLSTILVENVVKFSRFFFLIFFFKNIKTPAGVFYWKANSTVFTKRKKETKLTLTIYKASGKYLQGFRELMQIKLSSAAMYKIPRKAYRISGN